MFPYRESVIMNTEMRRRLFTPIVRGLLVCLLGSSGFVAAATTTEVESNDWPNPQLIEVPAEGLTISARINKAADVDDDDVDYFTFEAAEGDTLSIEIKGALNAARELERAMVFPATSHSIMPRAVPPSLAAWAIARAKQSRASGQWWQDLDAKNTQSESAQIGTTFWMPARPLLRGI